MVVSAMGRFATDRREFSSRFELKEHVAISQYWRCPITDDAIHDGGAYDLHEFFVPKSKKGRVDINLPINCVVIARRVHDGSEMSAVERDRLCFLHKMSLGYTHDDYREFLSYLQLRTFGSFEAWLYRHDL